MQASSNQDWLLVEEGNLVIVVSSLCLAWPLGSWALLPVPMFCWRLTGTTLIYNLAWHLSKHQLLFPLHLDFHDV